ncbi:glycosyltransferase [Geotalea daltonii FRC-32]|uniref:Glycosyltransferase n=1 Tax=Geotalea daltonii (strain DSM 22248 / JCM 15807 / FRC-32) TaxID=316067 RepID=B9M582_GEODF|nr:glycosyltransferase family 4 protein [Geotalea daltonii]ACM19837.1 glycosyltransferase [Geotalea daltonii FRC-32]
MKIVFLAPFGIRPKGTLIARMVPLAAELQLLGHEVVIIAPPYTNPEDSGKTETVRGVRLHNIALGPRNKIMAAPILAWRMFRAALAEKPAIIHLFKPKGYGGLAAMLHLVLQKAGLRLPPVFVDTDDWEGSGGMNELHAYSSLEKKFYCFQEQWLIRLAVGVTVASRALQAMVVPFAGEGRKVLYLPNCVSAAPGGDGESLRQRLDMGTEVPVLLLYTRFFEFSQEKLYWLFSEIKRRVPGVRFAVVGKGRKGEETALVEAAAAKGFADSLVMPGWVEPGEILHYLAAADVAIYPFADTLVNRCKCPAKLTELLVAGLPVVADRVGQVVEYMNPQLDHLLCDPEDWPAMVERVVTLLNDPLQRRVQGDLGRRYILQNFNWRSWALQLSRYYEECI